MIRRKALQRADGQERFIVPDCPEADVGGLQPGEVQGVRAAWRCFRAGTGQMEPQEIDYPRVGKVAWDDAFRAGFFPELHSLFLYTTPSRHARVRAPRL